MRYKGAFFMILISVLLFGCGEKVDTIKLRKESEHFKYNSTKADKDSLSDLEKNLESNYDRIANDLNVTLDEKINVTIYPNINEFYKAIGYTEAEDWLVGVARNGEILMVSPLNPGSVHNYDSLMKIIVHEYTHILVGNINPSTDIYLNEGTAVVEANQIDSIAQNYLKETAKTNKLPTIDYMKNNYSRLEQPYFLSGGFVDFIIKEYGYDKIIAVIKNPDNIEEIIGLTKEEIIVKWSEYIFNNY